ncbi:MAG: ribosomal RNA small subunit methyltransferase A [Planctomycetes bacterium]|nr:ribosomal RNA small subunit methyltransferase A [Planctomycetota bacterium]
MKLGDLKRLLEQHGLRPQQMFGQNFLVDPALLQAIPEDAGLQAGDRVLEVGPGAGALTAELLRHQADVYAVEIDRGMCELLRERFESSLEGGQLRLLQADVLAKDELFHREVEEWWHQGTPPRLIANLPYAISGPFLGRLPGRRLQNAALLLQREVAVKAAGKVGSKDYGPLTVRLSLAFKTRVGRRLPPEVFWPRPQIESAFLHLEPRADAPSAAVDKLLATILKLGFGQRRKRLLGRLAKQFPAAAEALRQGGVHEQARAEQVEPALWLQAALALQ